MLILTPFSTKIRLDFQDVETAAHTLVKTSFVGGRLFSWTHKWMLRILRTLSHPDCYQKLQLWRIFHQKKKQLFLSLLCQSSNLKEESLLFFYFWASVRYCLILILYRSSLNHFWWLPHLGQTHIHAFSQLSCKSHRILPYLFRDSYKYFFDRAVRGFPLIGWSLNVPKSLNFSQHGKLWIWPPSRA